MSDIKRVWANPESLWSEGRVKFVECVELVYASDYDAAQAELAAMREELAKLKEVTNFQEAVACVFDMAKIQAANTSSRVWDEQLEDFAEDVIDFAPEYKRQWKDIGELCKKLRAAEQRNTASEHLLTMWYSENALGRINVDDSAYHVVTTTAEHLDAKPTESGASE